MPPSCASHSQRLTEQPRPQRPMHSGLLRTVHLRRARYRCSRSYGSPLWSPPSQQQREWPELGDCDGLVVGVCSPGCCRCRPTVRARSCGGWHRSSALGVPRTSRPSAFPELRVACCLSCSTKSSAIGGLALPFCLLLLIGGSRQVGEGRAATRTQLRRLLGLLGHLSLLHLAH